jgi:alkanesulfonate monooxygenase SsuD/methylene tetrahydromethanopterin reductase-like flavin-dependent oxidoreductase (luciferase family)
LRFVKALRAPTGLENAVTAASRRPHKVGLHIPNGDSYVSCGINRWRDVLTMARAAEDAGFDSVCVADHMLFRFDDGLTQGRWEAWSLLAALAAATKRIEIGPLVSCMSFRNPAMLAKIAETVDEISGGRLILGIGAGWHEPEYVAYGFPFDHRAGRFEEGLAILHGLLRSGEVSFEGRYERAIDCEMRPRGPRPGRIPIMIGSTGERMLGLVARYADIWTSNWVKEPCQIAPLREAVDAACVAAGRNPATLARAASVLIDLPNRAGHWSWLQPLPSEPRGSAEIADLLRGFTEEGISHVHVWLDPSSPEGLRAFAPVLEELDRGNS